VSGQARYKVAVHFRGTLPSSAGSFPMGSCRGLFYGEFYAHVAVVFDASEACVPLVFCAALDAVLYPDATCIKRCPPRGRPDQS
jgi:hypothetical protein